jgi:hypothetical protein
MPTFNPGNTVGISVTLSPPTPGSKPQEDANLWKDGLKEKAVPQTYLPG